MTRQSHETADPGPGLHPAGRARGRGAGFRAVGQRFPPDELSTSAPACWPSPAESGEHATLPLQGCGHFAVEAAIRTFVPRGGGCWCPRPGPMPTARSAWRGRSAATSSPAGRRDRTDRPGRAGGGAARRPGDRPRGLVYSETGSGIIHDVPALAEAAGRAGRRVIVDAVSAFGALPLDLRRCRWWTPSCSPPTSAWKGCRAWPSPWRGSTGWSPARAGRQLVAGPGRHLPARPARRLGQLPLHAAGAGAGRVPDVALDLYDAEGGGPARLARYTANMRALYDGVRALGLRPTCRRRCRGRSWSTCMRRDTRPGRCRASWTR